MKLVNIILSCVLVMGLATSCGSRGNAKKAASKTDDGFVSIFDGKTTTGWRGYDKPAFPDEGWKWLMVHFIVLAPEQVKPAMAVILSMIRN